jgi:hypothetical protein
MLWSRERQLFDWPFEKEAELEAAILDAKAELFGESRIYLDVKKLIGQRGKTQNIPDGYLLDLSSRSKPVLYLVEVELATHDPLRHVAQQLLEFSLSFKSTPQKMKSILRETLQRSSEAVAKCEEYAFTNAFNNIDYLLEQMIYPDEAFRALVIIDELEEELERILRSSLRFPVETMEVGRFKSASGEVLLKFEPFLYELSVQSSTAVADTGNTPAIDPSDIDTIVVPAREEGFHDVFLGEQMWRSVRIHESMIPRIKFAAAYQVAPVQAITHVADVERIERWKDTPKYAIYFKAPAREIGPVRLAPGGRVLPPQSSRYTSFAKLQTAKTLDDVF